MTAKEFIRLRNLLSKRLARIKKEVDKEYTVIVNQFIADNSPIRKMSVYELRENGIKRRGFSRFIIYDQQLRVFDKHVMVVACGWWLDKNNVPAKWDIMTVAGVGNPAVFEISENQQHEKHPDYKD